MESWFPYRDRFVLISSLPSLDPPILVCRIGILAVELLSQPCFPVRPILACETLFVI